MDQLNEFPVIVILLLIQMIASLVSIGKVMEQDFAKLLMGWNRLILNLKDIETGRFVKVIKIKLSPWGQFQIKTQKI